MSYTMERWYSATGQRFSMRSYGGAPDAEDMEALEKAAEFLSGDSVRIVLCKNEKIFKPILLGSGRIKGTDCFAVVIQKGEEPARCGYIGESFILECTALGLGTCWLGMTYKKGAALKAAELKEGESAVCVIAFGKPGEAYVGRARRSLTELTGLSQDALMALPEWQQYALSCARLAPSAVNAQPWDFIVRGDELCIRRTGGNFGFGKMDQGIAMLHMELGASHASVAGHWRQEGETAVFTIG